MWRAFAIAALALTLNACATMQNVVQPTKGFYPYRAGLQQFDDGAPADAARNLQYALDAGGLSPADQANAHKHLAFIHCAANRERPCYDEFRKGFAIDPNLKLAPAESGHPVWGPVFITARNDAAKGESEKAEARAEVVKAELARVDVKSTPLLAVGLRQYDDGDYDAAAKSLNAAIEQGLTAKELAIAYKNLAFIHCASQRTRPCREDFRRALAADPSLELTPAEAGHPVWGPVFRAVKAGR